MTIRNPKLLCLVNHHFGPSPGFDGKSVSQEASTRRRYVEQVVDALRALGNVDVRICGVPGRHLVPIDIEFRLSDPRLLVYESLAMMAGFSSEFDYFVNIEDDILLEREAFERITAFDAESLVNECLHPNRMEDRHDGSYCVDLEAMPGWTFHTRTFAGHQLRVALNPHSGLCVLSRAKLRYAMERVDLRRREQIVGGYMASAYANLHGPFAMFRVTDPLGAHKVTHLDWWKNPVASVAGSDVGDVPLTCEARVEEPDHLLEEPPTVTGPAAARGVRLQAPAWVRGIVGRMTGRAAARRSGGPPPPGTTEC